MKRILVVYFSRSGYTAFAAQQIARRCGADLACIHDRTPRTGIGGYVRSALQALLGTRPAIRLDACRLEDYDLVIVGTPVWAWNMASPVRSFLSRYGRRCAQLAVFCTYGGSGHQRVMDDMAQLWGRPVVARLGLTQQQVEQRLHALDVTRFVAYIKRWMRLQQSDQPVLERSVKSTWNNAKGHWFSFPRRRESIFAHGKTPLLPPV